MNAGQSRSGFGRLPKNKGVNNPLNKSASVFRAIVNRSRVYPPLEGLPASGGLARRYSGGLARRLSCPPSLWRSGGLARRDYGGLAC